MSVSNLINDLKSLSTWLYREQSRQHFSDIAERAYKEIERLQSELDSRTDENEVHTHGYLDAQDEANLLRSRLRMNDHKYKKALDKIERLQSELDKHTQALRDICELFDAFGEVDAPNKTIHDLAREALSDEPPI